MRSQRTNQAGHGKHNCGVAEPDVEAAYWGVDNVVVVQGSLFQAAEYVVLPAVVALQSAPSLHSKRWILELLVQIAFGSADPSEVRLGNGDVLARCRAEMAQGLSFFYALLADPDRHVRASAIDLVGSLEGNKSRLIGVFEALLAAEENETNRTYIAEALRIASSDPE